ncbi:hypothetical protein Bbelb_052290 [Branchiostoma belcheri]|nr:hypothetical protein Bbelb_052290 [Branchiostoma belcheri]
MPSIQCGPNSCSTTRHVDGDSFTSAGEKSLEGMPNEQPKANVLHINHHPAHWNPISVREEGRMVAGYEQIGVWEFSKCCISLDCPCRYLLDARRRCWSGAPRLTMHVESN